MGRLYGVVSRENCVLDLFYGTDYHMVDRIRHRLALTSLQYQTLPDMLDAIGLPKKKVCTYC